MSVGYNSPVTSATLSSVSGSASNVTLLSANPARIGATFFNDSSAPCNLKFGVTASSTSFTVQIAAGGYYEMPSGPVYAGQIDAVWNSASGAMRITEY